jgi:phage terminase small subunit
MAAKTTPAGERPPAELGSAGAKLWADVMREFTVEDHLQPVLLGACQEHQRAQDAEAAVARDGQTVVDRYGGLKQHPSIAVARSSRLAVARLLGALNLDPPEAEPGRGRYPRGFKR